MTASPPPATPAVCLAPTAVDTIDDGGGVPDATGSTDLEDVQILADDDTIAVAWARQSNFLYGDSWRSPHLAIRSKADPSWRQVELPTLAYACALYGAAATNTMARPFVSWGVLNNSAFEVFGELPVPQNQPAPTTPLAEVTTTKQTVTRFVASRNVAAGVVHENKCDPSCLCGNDPHDMALWVRSLDPAKPWAQRVSLRYDYDDQLGVPALAMGETGGVLAYRVKSKLHLAWLDADGKPLASAPLEPFDAGDVGAPAVAMAGTEAIVVWARRASKADPYELQSMRLAYGAAPIAPTPIKTPGSAFAPSVLADATSVTLAWMEGDAGKRGQIHVARELTGPSVVVSGDETNARDPELSGSPSRPAIVWQSFTKARLAGVLRVARLDCAR